jgi:hypothetical protein
MEEPDIPPEIFSYIKRAYEKGDYPSGDNLQPIHIRHLCRSITVKDDSLLQLPEELSEKYRSKKYKRKKMVDLSKYAEKWITIKYFLTDRQCSPPLLDESIVMEMRRFFANVLVPFCDLRHSVKCDEYEKLYNRRPTKCHKTHKCRFAIININLLMKCFFQNYYRDDKEMLEKELKWWPQLSKSKTDELTRKYLLPVYRYNNWDTSSLTI